MENIYCEHCGRLIDKKSMYCIYCGKKTNISNRSFNPMIKLLDLFSSCYKVSVIHFRKKRNVFNVKINGLNKFNKVYKKIAKIIFAFFLVSLITFICYYAYSYYNYSIIPQNELDAYLERNNAKILRHDSMAAKSAYHFIFNCYNDLRGNGQLYKPDNHSRIKELGVKSVVVIKNRAYSGDAKCQYYLGNLFYYKNPFVESDNVKAAYWWNESAKNDYPAAYNNIGVAYQNGIGVSKNLLKAVEFFKTGAEKGNAKAQYNYGIYFKTGLKIKVGNHTENRKTISASYVPGTIRKYFDDSLMEFVTIYSVQVPDYKIVIEADIEQAKYWWRKAAEQGDKKAIEALQRIYE